MTDLERLGSYYHGLGDDALREAAASGSQAYDAGAWHVITMELKARGLDVPSAIADKSMAVSQAELPLLSEAEAEAELRLAERQSRRGIRYLLGGLFVTAGSYALASVRGGGIYIVAWGAPVFGIIELARAARRQDRASAALADLRRAPTAGPPNER